MLYFIHLFLILLLKLQKLMCMASGYVTFNYPVENAKYRYCVKQWRYIENGTEGLEKIYDLFFRDNSFHTNFQRVKNINFPILSHKISKTRPNVSLRAIQGSNTNWTIDCTFAGQLGKKITKTLLKAKVMIFNVLWII